MESALRPARFLAIPVRDPDGGGPRRLAGDIEPDRRQRSGFDAGGLEAFR